MRNLKVNTLVAAVLCLGSWSFAQTPTFEPDQAIEVREGDTWSAAKVVKKEGRRVQIRYDDGTEEWVTPDRVRVPGGAAPAAPAAGDKPAGAKPAAPKPPAKPAVRSFTNGQSVQVKWGGQWRDAKITNRRNDWYWIQYTNFGKENEWVQHWRVRKIGEVNYDIGYAQPSSFKNPTQPPAEPAGDAPLRPGEKAPPREGVPEIASDVKMLQRGGARNVVPALAGNTWKYVPTAAAESVNLNESPMGLDMVGADAMEKRPEVVIGGRFAGVLRAIDFFERQWTRLQVFDLQTGEATWLGELPLKTKLLAVFPGGKQIATNSTDNDGNQRVDLWTLEGGEAKPLVSFLPFSDGKSGGKPVEWAAALDDKTLLLASNEGVVSCVEVPAARLKWELPSGERKKPTLSPDGKTLAVYSELGLLLVRTSDGSVVAGITSPPSGSISFSPDGKTLVAVSNGTAQAYDLTTGKPGPRLGLPAGLSGSDGMALNGGKVWMGGVLLDLTAAAPVARYTLTGDKPEVAFGKLVGITKAGQGKALCVWDVTADAKPAKADKVELGKGASVALDIQLEGGEGQQKAIDALTKSLEQRGVAVSPAADLKLVARVETGKSETREYEEMHGAPWSRGRQSVTVTPKTTRFYIEKGGVKLWEVSSSSSAGSILSRKKDQTFQDAANEASRANPQIVSDTPLPDTVIVADVKSLPEFTLVPGGAKAK